MFGFTVIPLEPNTFAVGTISSNPPKKINHFRGSEVAVGTSQDSDSSDFVSVSWVCSVEVRLGILPTRTASIPYFTIGQFHALTF